MGEKKTGRNPGVLCKTLCFPILKSPHELKENNAYFIWVMHKINTLRRWVLPTNYTGRDEKVIRENPQDTWENQFHHFIVTSHISFISYFANLRVTGIVNNNWSFESNTR